MNKSYIRAPILSTLYRMQVALDMIFGAMEIRQNAN